MLLREERELSEKTRSPCCFGPNQHDGSVSHVYQMVRQSRRQRELRKRWVGVGQRRPPQRKRLSSVRRAWRERRRCSWRAHGKRSGPGGLQGTRDGGNSGRETKAGVQMGPEGLAPSTSDAALVGSQTGEPSRCRLPKHQSSSTVDGGEPPNWSTGCAGQCRRRG